jgi:Ni/Co efflux regulator RcnB
MTLPIAGGALVHPVSVNAKFKKENVMKPLSSSLAAIISLALLSTQASAQKERKPRNDSSPEHTERHRVAPSTKSYSGPSRYRPGTRPRNLDQLRRKIVPKTYRHNYRALKRYRAKPYIRPKGWYYHRWIFGDILPSLFWARQYWINDFWLYGLPVPPRGHVWVRYDKDALLVEISTGVILQVIYDIYY